MEEKMATDVATLQQQVKALESGSTQQWKRLDEIRDRLPNWVVMTLSGLWFVIGFLVNWLMMCLK